MNHDNFRKEQHRIITFQLFCLFSRIKYDQTFYAKINIIQKVNILLSNCFMLCF